jgi:outer membrane protein
MNKAVFAVALLGLTALGSVAHAQSAAPAATDDAPVGKQAGTFMVRVRAIDVIPQDSSSSVSVIGGKVHVSDQVAPEVDLSYFFTDNIAIEGIAATTRHNVSASGTALGHVDVGSTWVLPPTVTLQYHFMPHSQFSPYVGAGLMVAFFYDEHPARPTVTKFGLTDAVGPALQAGFDYNVTGHWFVNFDVKQVFLETSGHINHSTIIAKTALNPTIVGLGVGYRF